MVFMIFGGVRFGSTSIGMSKKNPIVGALTTGQQWCLQNSHTTTGAQNSTVGYHERERLALLEFKHSVKDDFRMLSSWVGIDCCSWKGVLCDAATGSVASLQLRGNYDASFYYHDKDGYYLVCEKVNIYLAELGHLKHLDLSGNNFQGSKIPEFIGSFKQLSYLNLSNAGFNGIIPHHIGNLSNLKVLDLSLLILTPNDMSWVSGLSSLEHLDLSELNFSQAKDTDMVLYMIPSLTYLSLSSCELSNANLRMHLNSTKILPNIKHLDLSNNKFKGQLPSVFQNMTSLTFLDLSYYSLSPAWNSLNLLITIPSLSELHLLGCELHNALSLPTYFNSSSHSNIQYLDLRYNSIHGRFPSDLTNMTSLRVLDVSRNNLNGSIPESLGRLTNLRVLNLCDNSLTDSIPKALQTLRSLEVLNLYSNDLTGPIPTFRGKLTQLNLSGNRFSGSIPDSLGRLTSLTDLSLGSNKLTGPIPISIGRLSSLQSFSLSSNLLVGKIPISVGQLIKLTFLDVSYNSLEGVVLEAHFANLSFLIDLDTTSNHNLIFNISNEWIPPFQLRRVSLSSCKIEGGIPHWLQTQRNLKELVLSNASLHGLLPTWLLKLPIISYLDLSHNKLSGTLINLPYKNQFNRFDSEYLLLQDNLFSGPIPRSLCTRTHLEILDVSRNRLSGNIPGCVENLQHMVMLILGSNRFSRALPSSLGYISSLEWLQLNENNFNGTLPEDLGKLRSLSVLDLGNNGLSGNIPKWIGENLTNLMVLRLHKNNFRGGIPQSLCKCSYLHILDVAHNNLTGSIPHCFGELSSMINARYQGLYYEFSYDDIFSMERNENLVLKGMNLEYTKTLDFVFNLDLSSNKLTGEIPKEITTLALLVGLNLSHNHLSGSIPYSIGKMKALNSLDFSDNQFTGRIPPSMAALNFLSVMNLSHNNLSGRIPTGNQLQTLTDPSIYAGNKDLCGTPLSNNCSNHENPPTTRKNKNDDADEPKKLWFYVDITCGFATGFWGIIGFFLFKKQWRQKFL